MFNLDCISLTEEDRLREYTGKLVDSGIKVKKYESLHETEILESTDGIIIFEDDLNNIGEVCKFIIEIKRKSNPLLWVFVKEEMSSTKLFYLQVGADAVFSYDKEVEESILTITNGLKRGRICTGRSNQQDLTTERKNDFELKPGNLSVIKDDVEILLTRIEYKIMELLLNNLNGAITYQDIHNKVWGEGDSYKQYRVANAIFHLRQKVEEDSMEPRYIKTVRSKGYMMTI